MCEEPVELVDQTMSLVVPTWRPGQPGDAALPRCVNLPRRATFQSKRPHFDGLEGKKKQTNKQGNGSKQQLYKPTSASWFKSLVQDVSQIRFCFPTRSVRAGPQKMSPLRLNPPMVFNLPSLQTLVPLRVSSNQDGGGSIQVRLDAQIRAHWTADGGRTRTDPSSTQKPAHMHRLELCSKAVR